MMNLSRRDFVSKSALLLAFGGLQNLCARADRGAEVLGFGSPRNDPAGLLELPPGFSYRVISRSGERMKTDGLVRPGKPDGMGCFSRPDGKVALVINHELNRESFPPESFAFDENEGGWPEQLERRSAWAWTNQGVETGGTSNLIWNPKTGEVETEFLSLIGTNRNCAGGITPWGSWISCEEPDPAPVAGNGQHGWCFEVPADADSLVPARHLAGLGRFRHEAIAVDPRNGYIYLTEDDPHGLFYRWIPDAYFPGNRPDLGGGRLQALAIEDGVVEGSRDTRNHPLEEEQQGVKRQVLQPKLPVGQKLKISWLDMEDVAAREMTLKERGAAQGAAVFTRAEGIFFDEQSGSVWFVCTDGGEEKTGQIFRHQTDELGGDGELELFIESGARDLLRNGDNIAVMPWGDMLVCEDHSLGTHIVGVTPKGEFYRFARDPQLGDEFAGVCFDEPSQTLFVNLQGAGLTFAINGPWPKA